MILLHILHESIFIYVQDFFYFSCVAIQTLNCETNATGKAVVRCLSVGLPATRDEYIPYAACCLRGIEQTLNIY